MIQLHARLPRLSRRSALAGIGALLVTDRAARAARAQPYPSHPVRLIVPAPAGTSPDLIARQWGERFSKATRQAVVVDNRPGASSIIAARAVATAPADGHTLLYT